MRSRLRSFHLAVFVVPLATFICAGCKPRPQAQTEKSVAKVQLVRPPIASPQDVEAAASALRTADVRVRLSKLYELATSGSEKAERPLLQVLKEGSVAEQRIAVLGLGLIKGKASAAALVDFAKTTNDAMLLDAIAWALGQLGEKSSEVALLELFNRDHGPRSQAQYALARLADPTQAFVLLESELEPSSYATAGQIPVGNSYWPKFLAENSKDRLTAVLAHQSTCTGIAIKFAQTDDEVDANIMAAHIAQSKLFEELSSIPPQCVGEFRRVLEQYPDPKTQAALVGVLLTFGTDDDVAILKRLTYSKDEHLAARAAEILMDMGRPIAADEATNATLWFANLDDPKTVTKWFDFRSDPSDWIVEKGSGLRFSWRWLLKRITGKSYAPDAIQFPAALSAAEFREMAKRSDSADWAGFIAVSQPNGTHMVLDIVNDVRGGYADDWYRFVALSLARRSTDDLIKESLTRTGVALKLVLAELVRRNEPQAKRRIKEMLSGPSPSVRVAAIELWSLPGTGLSVGDILPLLSTADDDVVNAVLNVLMRVGDPTEIAQIPVESLSKRVGVRISLIAALCRHAPELAEKLLLQNLASLEPGTRKATLAWMKGNGRYWEETWPVVTKVLLSAAGDRSFGAVRAALFTGDYCKPEILWKVLHRAPNDPMRGQFLRALSHPSKAVRSKAGRCLAAVVKSFPPDDAIAPVVERNLELLLASDASGYYTDAHVSASDLQAWMPPANKKVVEWLLTNGEFSALDAYLYGDGSADPDPLVKILTALLDRKSSLRRRYCGTRESPRTGRVTEQAARNPRIRPLVTALLKESDNECGAFAAEIIAISRDRSYVPILQALIKSHPNDGVTSHLYSALVFCGKEEAYGDLVERLGVVGQREWFLSDAALADLPSWLAVATIFSVPDQSSRLAVFMRTRNEPQLLALHPRLEDAASLRDKMTQAPIVFDEWLSVATSKHLGLPLEQVVGILRSNDAILRTKAALYLVEQHETEHLAEILKALCRDGGFSESLADACRYYSVVELKPMLSHEYMSVRECARSLIDTKAGNTVPIVPALSEIEGARSVERPYLLSEWLRAAPPEAVQKFIQLRPYIETNLEERWSFWLPLATLRHPYVKEHLWEMLEASGAWVFDNANHVDAAAQVVLAVPAADLFAQYLTASSAARRNLVTILVRSPKPAAREILTRLLGTSTLSATARVAVQGALKAIGSN